MNNVEFESSNQITITNFNKYEKKQKIQSQQSKSQFRLVLCQLCIVRIYFKPLLGCQELKRI